MQIMSRYRELDRQLVTHQTWVRYFWQKRQIHTSTVSVIVANNVVLVSAHRMCIVWAFTQFELLLAVSSCSMSTRCTARTQYRRLPILHGCENVWRHSTCSSRLYRASARKSCLRLTSVPLGITTREFHPANVDYGGNIIAVPQQCGEGWRSYHAHRTPAAGWCYGQ